MRFAAATSVAAAALAVAAGQSQPCAWTVRGVPFDLSPMTLNKGGSTDKFYSVPDERVPNSSFVFDVCALVSPPVTTPVGQCETNGRTNNSLPAMGWQLDEGPDTDNCYRVGASQISSWSAALLDVEFPARGVALTYSEGDSVWCNYGQTSRSLTLEMQCAAVVPTATSYAAGAFVVEYDECAYKVTLPTIAGCPTSCVADSKICSSNGVCGFNTDANTTQCFCYKGFTGAMCASPVSNGSSGLGVEGVFLILVCIALAAVLGVLVFMILKLRKLNVNPTAYADLQGRFNELGQMA